MNFLQFLLEARSKELTDNQLKKLQYYKNIAKERNERLVRFGESEVSDLYELIGDDIENDPLFKGVSPEVIQRRLNDENKIPDYQEYNKYDTEKQFKNVAKALNDISGAKDINGIKVKACYIDDNKYKFISMFEDESLGFATRLRVRKGNGAHFFENYFEIIFKPKGDREVATDKGTKVLTKEESGVKTFGKFKEDPLKLDKDVLFCLREYLSVHANIVESSDLSELSDEEKSGLSLRYTDISRSFEQAESNKRIIHERIEPIEKDIKFSLAKKGIYNEIFRTDPKCEPNGSEGKITSNIKNLLDTKDSLKSIISAQANDMIKIDLAAHIKNIVTQCDVRNDWSPINYATVKARISDSPTLEQDEKDLLISNMKSCGWNEYYVKSIKENDTRLEFYEAIARKIINSLKSGKKSSVTDDKGNISVDKLLRSYLPDGVSNTSDKIKSLGFETFDDMRKYVEDVFVKDDGTQYPAILSDWIKSVIIPYVKMLVAHTVDNSWKNDERGISNVAFRIVDSNTVYDSKDANGDPITEIDPNKKDKAFSELKKVVTFILNDLTQKDGTLFYKYSDIKASVIDNAINVKNYRLLKSILIDTTMDIWNRESWNSLKNPDNEIDQDGATQTREDAVNQSFAMEYGYIRENTIVDAINELISSKSIATGDSDESSDGTGENKLSPESIDLISKFTGIDELIKFMYDSDSQGSRAINVNTPYDILTTWYSDNKESEIDWYEKCFNGGDTNISCKDMMKNVLNDIMK